MPPNTRQRKMSSCVGKTTFWASESAAETVVIPGGWPRYRSMLGAVSTTWLRTIDQIAPPPMYGSIVKVPPMPNALDIRPSAVRMVMSTCGVPARRLTVARAAIRVGRTTIEIVVKVFLRK